MVYPRTNLILDLLPSGTRTSLFAHLQPVSLAVNTVLYEPEEVPRYAHFITSGMASIVTGMSDGESAEVGIVGREGMPETMHLLGPAPVQTRCFMQIDGSGLRMKFKDFERIFQQDEVVRRMVLHFVQFQSLMLAQFAACNRLHEVEERLARWLLMVQDRLDDPTLRLTQEFLAMMLGARRSTVTVVAGTLQRSGLIEYKRGQVKILDRPALENTACECYHITHRLFMDFARSNGQSSMVEHGAASNGNS